MKFSNAIAFVIVNLAATATAVALPQTQTQVIIGTRTALVERQAKNTQAGGGKVPATKTQVVIGTATALVEREAGQSPFPIIDARSEAAPAALAPTLLKVPRHQGVPTIVAAEAKQTGPLAAPQDEGSLVDILVDADPVEDDQNGSLLEARQSNRPRLSARDTEDDIMARQTPAPLPVEAREEGSPLEARQSNRPRLSARDAEDEIMARQTPAPVPVEAREEGSPLEARQSNRPRLSARDAEDEIMARQTPAPVPARAL